MVFVMLMETADAPDPSRFRETELYRRCVAAGVVPATEADIPQNAYPRAQQPSAPAGQNSQKLTLPLQYRIRGMWCPACAWVIQTALERLEGVSEVLCDFASDRLRCRYDPVHTRPDRIERAIRQLGYEAATEEGTESGRHQRSAFVRLSVSAFLSVNVMMLSWALYSGFFTDLSLMGIRYLSWPILAMATVVLIYGGGPVIRKAWSGLKAGAPGMEVLIVLGAGSAYGYSLINFLSGSIHLYFDTASMLIALLLLGKMLESQAKSRVRQDLDGFMALRSRKVRLCSSQFPAGRYVDIDRLAVGDLFRVGADDVVPADGRVVEGRAQMDASAITGEPRSLSVKAGDAILSGSRVVSGDIKIRADQVGDQALLGQMITLVLNSLSRKTSLETRTDRLLVMLVALLVGLSAATGLGGYFLGLGLDRALVRAITVLVIACPCALGIAIPLARVAGIAGAGRMGLLVRNFEAFERTRNIHSVVFDKTGTITAGQWTLKRVQTSCGHSASQIVALAAGLEHSADHAVARAIKDYAKRQGIEPAPVEGAQVSAQGVSGRWGGKHCKLGSRTFALPADAGPGRGSSAEIPDESLSQVYMSLNGVPCAELFFGDALREGLPGLVQQLKSMGYELHLISGDSREATAAVAAKVGIDRWQGRLLPQDKAALVARLQAEGRLVMMVGDGVNDAPAMAQADLAVAVHAGTALAQQAADVTLMRGDPRQMLQFMEWSRRVNRKVRQNLWCAFGYNLIGIPVAIAGLLSPLVAVSAMLLSSLTVIGNTLLLVRHQAVAPETPANKMKRLIA